MRSLILLLALFGACAPQPSTEREHHISAATDFTRRYKSSRLAQWNVRATAAGADCSVLLVTTSVSLEEPMIEALHYGTGPYETNDGGVQRFCRERAFRGVAYRDGAGHTWTFGATDNAEATDIKACQ